MKKTQRSILVPIVASVVLAACNPAQPTPNPTAPKPAVTFVPAGTREAPAAQVTPTPRPAGAPVLVDRSPLRGEELTPGQPIVLSFDQAMDKDSVASNLRVTSGGAAVSGKLTWSADNIAAFTPDTPWARNASVDIDLQPGARSSKGLALSRPEQFQVSTIGRLTVAQTLPADGSQSVAADGTITILFNRPVVPLTTLNEQASLPVPVVFEPPIEGRGQWLNTSIYVFKPARSLAAGTNYRGTVAAGLTDTTGAQLEEAFSFGFTVAPPSVVFITPAFAQPAIGLNAPITLTFSQKMDRASVEAAFRADPAVPGAFVWTDTSPPDPAPSGDIRVGQPPVPIFAGETLTFLPGELYARDTVYTVTVASSATAANGAALEAPFVTTFRTIPLPAVASTTPGNGETNADTGTFAIRFTAPVSPETILRNLSFTPAVSLTEVYSFYDTYNNQFSINLQLRPSTAYRVRIGAGISDDYGATLGQATEVRFTTRPLQPFVAFQSAGLIGTYNAANPTVAFTQYRNVSEISFELARLTPADVHRFVGADSAYDNLRTFKPSESQLVRSWRVVSKAALNETGTEKLALDAAGGALAPGLYLLTASAPEVQAFDPNSPPTRQILVVTNRHLTLKRSEKSALVWVTDLNTGQPVPNAEVRIFDRSFTEVGAGTTEAASATAGQTEVVMPASALPYDPLYSVVDADGPGFGMLWSETSNGISPYDFNLPARYAIEPYFAYMHTDRPIYRPGQMVFFKGIIRKDDDARYSIDTELGNRRPYLTINSAQGQVVLSQTVQLNANGTFSGALALDNAAPTGFYFGQLCVPLARTRPEIPPCAYFGVNFTVAAYRQPEFEVNISQAKPDYIDGETVTATVRSSYFFGGNVGGATVRWTLLAAPYVFDRYTGPGGYTFGDSADFFRGSGFSELVASGEGKTAPDGTLVVTLPASLATRTGSTRFTFEASVTDVNDQSVSARTDVILHKGEVYFGVDPVAYVGVIGEKQDVNVIAVDLNGAPVPNRAGAVQFSRREWFTTQRVDQFGFREYTSVPSDTLVTQFDFNTDADGRAVASFVPDSGGIFLITANGDRGNPGATSLYITEPGAYVTWRVDNNDRIELRTDKTEYKVGDTARILIPSPFQGSVQALVTIERGNFLKRETRLLTSNSEVIEIPIEAAFAPTAYVSVLLVKGVDGNNPVPAFKLGYAAFKVDVSQFALNVSVSRDKPQYTPRDTAVYELTVTDAAGQPVDAELSVALVDKSVLSLSDPNSLPLIDAFYGQRALSVRTADSLSINVDRVNLAADRALAAKGGGGGGPGGADGTFTRQLFRDTAYWQAEISTVNGKARIEIPLPDNLTTWVLDARAVTSDTRVGTGRDEVLSTKPLLIRPVTPRFFVLGDTATLGGVVNNNSDTALDADVQLDVSGAVLTGDAIRKVNIPARGSVRVDWDVTIIDSLSALLTFTVKSGALQDSSVPSLATAPGGGIPILRYSAPETIGTAGDVREQGARLEQIALPARLDTGQGSLDLRVDTSLSAVAARGAQEIEEYPWESVEWTASRLLVALTSEAGPDRDAIMSRATQRLFVEQKPDGGWGWWSGDTSQPWLSAYVLFAIARAREAGMSYDESSLARAREYLLQQIGIPADQLATGGDANRQALILFALGESGTPDSGRLGALYEARAKLGHYGRALLALAIQRSNPGDTRVKSLLADVQSAALVSATGQFWQETERDGFNFYGRTRSTSIALLALATLDPQSALAPGAVRWLIAARSGNGWESTIETAWAAQALSAWGKQSSDANPTYAWRVALNDQTVLDGNAGDRDQPGRALRVEIGALLRNQANALAFERGSGQGNLYYTAHLRAFLPVEDVKAVNRGMVIARKYERADCTPTPDKPCEAITAAKIGDNIRVRLTIVSPGDRNFVRITDPLPAGTEAINRSLRTSQQAQPGQDLGPRPIDLGFGGATGWGWWWFSNTDIRDNKVAIFASFLPAGTYEYVYTIRASLAGSFKVIPVSIEEQYLPEVFGRSDGSIFTVTR
jgi:alpha-2-macroglobulin